MSRKAPRANLINLRDELARAYKKPLYMDPEATWDSSKAGDDQTGTLITNAITPTQIEQVLAVAKPLYDTINGEAQFPAPMSELDRATYVRSLTWGLGLKLDRILPIPASPPDCSDCLGDASWLVNNDSWHEVINTPSYNRKPLLRAFRRLQAEGIGCQTPPDYTPRARSFASPMIGQWLAADEMIDLVQSYAEFLLTPPNGYPRDHEQRLRKIEDLVPHLVKWPILGFKPRDKDGRTLCVLVA